MSRDDMELLFNNVLLACQLSLGLWQFCKPTPVGALIQGVIGWLVRPLGLSPVYSSLQPCEGRVFKRTNCFVLQADIPSDKTGISKPEVNTMNLYYLGRDYLLERKGENSNMLFIDHKLCYYITHINWEELQNLKEVLCYGLDGPPRARVAVAGAAVELSLEEALRPGAERNRARPLDPALAPVPGSALDAARALDPAQALDAAHAPDAPALTAVLTLARHPAVAASEPALTAAVAAYLAALVDADTDRTTLFVKGKREFWKQVITGGVMTFKEVTDAIILNNQHVSARLNDDLLLPINLSVSEEKLLKIINLVALFFQTKKVRVHWLIPTALSFISALLEFSTTLRVWLYNKINVLFCYIMHLACDPLPRSWRRQVYSLGKWVENLSPAMTYN